jgi:CspA family cold shock protein
MRGTVNNWFEDRGYGFISENVTGKSYFVHITEVENQVELKVGDVVEFEEEESEKGLKAVNVKKVAKYTDII